MEENQAKQMEENQEGEKDANRGFLTIALLVVLFAIYCYLRIIYIPVTSVIVLDKDGKILEHLDIDGNVKVIRIEK